MLITNEDLSSLLLENHLLTQAQLDQSLAVAHKHSQTLYQTLSNSDLISDQHLAQLVADKINIPFVDLTEKDIHPDTIRLLPQELSYTHKVAAIQSDSNHQITAIAMADPLDQQTVMAINQHLQLSPAVYLASPNAISQTQSAYTKQGVDELKSQVLSSLKNTLTDQSIQDMPVTQIVTSILTFAHQTGVSDIHFQPMKDETVIRFRKDGILHDIVSLPSTTHARLISKIKIMAYLKTDEHFIPQDGKLTVNISDQSVELRVSIASTINGEKAVLRVLTGEARKLSLKDLGFTPEGLKHVTNAYTKPYGLILSTGPTGSGKTTTMYAILKLLDKPEVNIATIEDPVEYDMNRVSQIQVNQRVNITFAKGLRSILRQDPDIILVGEIRDEETARIAINAALTGHLVLSTMHTNDAASAVPRLIDMGIEPFLIASSLNLVIAQRLARKIHEGCRLSQEITLDSINQNFHSDIASQVFGDDATHRLYRGKGCQHCNQSGYDGRLGVFELLNVTDEIKQVIVTNHDSQSIHNLALNNGMVPMLQDGLQKVKQGLTTIDEITRVVS